MFNTPLSTSKHNIWIKWAKYIFNYHQQWLVTKQWSDGQSIQQNNQ